MDQLGYKNNNTFNVIEWENEFSGGKVAGSNAYYTIFNHGGPHVDVPKHMNLSKGIDSYAVDAFIGPLKVIDASNYPLGRSIPLNEVLKHNINPGDIVLIYTGYKPPNKKDTPHRIALTKAAATYLAKLPVKAFGTDAFNVESDDNSTPVLSDSPVERAAPIHYAFLTRDIPIFEQLFNVKKLIAKQNMYFIGQPLNIKDGDGMIVRPVVLIY